MGGVDEDVTSIAPNQIRSSSLSNVENVHLEPSNVTLSNVVDVSQIVVVETQVLAWKPHNRMSICWGFFCYEQWVTHGFGELINVMHNM
jgi:hypothetical protein